MGARLSPRKFANGRRASRTTLQYQTYRNNQNKTGLTEGIVQDPVLEWLSSRLRPRVHNVWVCGQNPKAYFRIACLYLETLYLIKDYHMQSISIVLTGYCRFSNKQRNTLIIVNVSLTSCLGRIIQGHSSCFLNFDWNVRTILKRKQKLENTESSPSPHGCFFFTVTCNFWQKENETE